MNALIKKTAKFGMFKKKQQITHFQILTQNKKKINN